MIMQPTNTIVAIKNYAAFNFYSSTEITKCNWAPKFGA